MKTKEYCTLCLQYREPKHFSVWQASGNKPKRCNFCLECRGAEVIARNIETAKANRALRPACNMTIADSEESKQHVCNRRKIESLLELKFIDDLEL